MTKREKSDELVRHVVECERQGRVYLSSTGLLDIWREALLTYLGKGQLTNPRGFNLKANRLLSDLRTVVPRFMQYLMSTEPYFPLGPRDVNNPQARLATRNWQDVLNDYMRRANTYAAMEDMLSFVFLYGIGGMEDRFEVDVVSRPEQSPVIDPSIGKIIGYEKKDSEIVRRKLRKIPRAPWEMLFHPHGNSLHEKKWSILKDITSSDEIRRLIDMKVFELPPWIKDEDLDKPPADDMPDDAQRQWRMDRSLYSEECQDGLGVLLRYYENPTREYKNGRWSYIWNSRIPLLKDGFIENPLHYVPKTTKPFTVFRDVTPPRPDRFYGSGIFANVKDLIKHRDDLMSVALDRLYLTSYGWWLYDPRAIEPEHMKRASYGARVPVKSTYDGAVSEAMYHVPGTDPPASIFQMGDFVDRLADERIGHNYITSGDPAPRKEAATTTMTLKAVGDARFEGQLRLMELSSMSDQGELSSCMLAQNLLPMDIIDIIGIERYMQAPVSSIHSINGGYVWSFKGSAQVVRSGQKLEALRQTWSMIGADPTVMRGDRAIVVRELIKGADTELSDDMIERVVPLASEPPTLTYEQQVQLQQQQAQQQSAMGMTGTPGMPPGKVSTQEQAYGIIGSQVENSPNEQAIAAMTRVMGQ